MPKKGGGGGACHTFQDEASGEWMGDNGIWIGDNGKEHGNYYSILGLYWGNGKEHGNYYSILLGLYRDSGQENENYHSLIVQYTYELTKEVAPEPSRHCSA